MRTRGECAEMLVTQKQLLKRGANMLVGVLVAKQAQRMQGHVDTNAVRLWPIAGRLCFHFLRTILVERTSSSTARVSS